MKVVSPAGTRIVSVVPSGQVSILILSFAEGPNTLANTDTVSPKQILVGQVGHIIESSIRNCTESGPGRITIESFLLVVPQ